MDRRTFTKSSLCLLGAPCVGGIASLGCIGQAPPKQTQKQIVWHGTGKRVVGYFTNWAQYRKRDCKFEVRHLDGDLFTHVIYSFAKINPGDRDNPKFELAPFEHNDLGPSGQYLQFTGLKQKYPHLKTLLAVGGWSFNDPKTAWIFTTMAEKPEYRKHFIEHAIGYLRQSDFDGLDLDWEYPVDPARGGRPMDKQNFTKLAAEFKQAARREAKATGRDELLLTMAAGASKADDLELDKLGQILDFLNLMTYDFNGSWSKQTGMNAPLLAGTNPEDDSYVKKSALNFISKGLPRDKLVLGMPTYGRTFGGVASPDPNAAVGEPGPKGTCTGEPGFMAFYEVEDLIESGQYKAFWHEASATPYAYDAAGKNWISYDDIRSIIKKVEFVHAEQLGGAMVWAIDLDDFRHGYPLISRISERLRRSPQAEPATAPPT